MNVYPSEGPYTTNNMASSTPSCDVGSSPGQFLSEMGRNNFGQGNWGVTHGPKTSDVGMVACCAPNPVKVYDGCFIWCDLPPRFAGIREPVGEGGMRSSSSFTYAGRSQTWGGNLTKDNSWLACMSSYANVSSYLGLGEHLAPVATSQAAGLDAATAAHASKAGLLVTLLLIGLMFTA
jgi:hypothetical protein